MIDAPWVAESPAQLVALIRLRVPPHEMQMVMGPGIGEVFTAVQEQGLTPTGPWFNHHFAQPTDVFDFAICVPVASPITAVGRVEPAVRRASTVVRTNYRGPYERLGEAWGQFFTAVEAEGHRCADDFWECYVRGPESESDPESYLTELTRPIIR